jgi:NAD(P)-dependent dehydrogenase (short-subunit alcohol dehydrogenase family)
VRRDPALFIPRGRLQPGEEVAVQELRDRVAVVTGGGGGIGRALALAFADEGMDVVLSDVDLSAAQTVADEVKGRGVRSLSVQTDVSDRAAVERLAEATYREMGGTHVLCNNAGVVTMRLAQDMSEADWDWVLGVNLYGVIHGIEAFLPRMLAANEGGHIVNTSSIAGLVPAAIPGIASYTTAKYGVVGLSESLALDLADKGIGVSVMCPGGVRSRIGEAGRNRPAEYGGPEAPSPVPGDVVPQETIEPEQLAAQIVRAIRANELYVLSHPETQPAVEARFAALLAAFDAFPG